MQVHRLGCDQVEIEKYANEFWPLRDAPPGGGRSLVSPQFPSTKFAWQGVVVLAIGSNEKIRA